MVFKLSSIAAFALDVSKDSLPAKVSLCMEHHNSSSVSEGKWWDGSFNLGSGPLLPAFSSLSYTGLSDPLKPSIKFKWEKIGSSF